MSVISGIDKQGAYVVTFSKTAVMDEAEITQIGADFETMVARAEQKRLLVDFARVTYMSSAMIGQLMMLKKQCESAGVVLKFCNVCPSVMEVFTIMRFNKLFSIYKDEEKALKAFDKKGWFG